MPVKSDQHTDPFDHGSLSLRHLASLSQDGLARFFEALVRSPARGHSFDRLDERLAVSTRAAYGLKGWLVSWHRLPDGSWLARLSGPDAVRTIERSSHTRVAAIMRAGRTMERIRAFRDRPRTPPVPADSDPRHADTP